MVFDTIRKNTIFFFFFFYLHNSSEEKIVFSQLRNIVLELCGRRKTLFQWHKPFKAHNAIGSSWLWVALHTAATSKTIRNLTVTAENRWSPLWASGTVGSEASSGHWRSCPHSAYCCPGDPQDQSLGNLWGNPWWHLHPGSRLTHTGLSPTFTTQRRMRKESPFWCSSLESRSIWITPWKFCLPEAKDSQRHCTWPIEIWLTAGITES